GVSAALPRLMLVPAQIATIASARATVFVLLNLRAILSTGPRVVLPSTSALNRRSACLPTNPFDVVTSEGDTNFLDFVLLPRLAATGPTEAQLQRSRPRKNILETLMRSFARLLRTSLTFPCGFPRLLHGIFMRGVKHLKKASCSGQAAA